ncbi:hypothetical protein GBAR_LOCUS5760 [Geodia barretti]|uniref:AB hydrolase-1 domain-containing protein n=1 Tax=Geodia barretti TaxID=519541 RepID=A0AA35RDL7_GEOBA|nr:hypothetical protein GBAR_LOCUS5760 [Geodia barretti]
MATGQRPESAAELIKLFRVTDVSLPYGGIGEGQKFHTNRGEFSGIIHRAKESTRAVIFVCGARGGFVGPGPESYARLSERFLKEGITSLRIDYRLPNDLLECALDLMVGAGHLNDIGYGPVVVVGHSFGGAVVIAAGATSPHIKGVVSLSPQTYGAGMAGQLAPRKLLVAHGKADSRLPFSCSLQIYEWAKEPKELVLFEDAEHRLEECRDELETLLASWIPATLDEEIEIPAVN